MPAQPHTPCPIPRPFAIRRVLFQDAAGGTFLYDASYGELMAPPDFSGELAVAVWDAADPHVVAAVNAEGALESLGLLGRSGGWWLVAGGWTAARRVNETASDPYAPPPPTPPTRAGTVHVYCHVPSSVQGPGVKLVGTQAAPRGAAPLALHRGLLTWHTREGPLQAQLLDTHRHLAEPSNSRGPSRACSGRWQQQLEAATAAATDACAGMGREEHLAARCEQALALGHFGQALAAAKQLGQPGMLREVALAALQFLELPVAVAAYEAAGDEVALAQLRPLLGLEDQNLLAGHITAITGGAGKCCWEEASGAGVAGERMQGACGAARL